MQSPANQHPPLSPLAYQLYGRQMILPELGQEGQQKIMASTVAVLGAGGLGAPALLYLAGAGVGSILVIDDDLVEPSNLHRQVIHSYSRVGASKADSAAQTLRELNPLVTVTTVKERLTDENALDLLQGVDALVDGSDNFPTRYAASRAAAALGIPHIWGAILGFDAHLSVFWAGKGPRYEDLYPQAPEPGSVPNCATAGVLGALAGTVGTAMALETIKVLTGVGRPLLGEVGYYSGLEGRWEYIPLRASHTAASEPQETSQEQGEEKETQRKLASPHPEPLPETLPETPLTEPQPQAPDQYGLEISWEDYHTDPIFTPALLIDVRESQEHAALSVPGSLHLPLSRIRAAAQEGTLTQLAEETLPSRRGTYALYCAAGVRSLDAARLLLGAGYDSVYSLEGGISAWIAGQEGPQG